MSFFKPFCDVMNEKDTKNKYQTLKWYHIHKEEIISDFNRYITDNLTDNGTLNNEIRSNIWDNDELNINKDYLESYIKHKLKNVGYENIKVRYDKRKYEYNEHHILTFYSNS